MFLKNAAPGAPSTPVRRDTSLISEEPLTWRSSRRKEWLICSQPPVRQTSIVSDAARSGTGDPSSFGNPNHHNHDHSASPEHHDFVCSIIRS
jgi:hypothetical protein